MPRRGEREDLRARYIMDVVENLRYLALFLISLTVAQVVKLATIEHIFSPRRLSAVLLFGIPNTYFRMALIDLLLENRAVFLQGVLMIHKYTTITKNAVESILEILRGLLSQEVPRTIPG